MAIAISQKRGLMYKYSTYNTLDMQCAQRFMQCRTQMQLEYAQNMYLLEAYNESSLNYG